MHAQGKRATASPPNNAAAPRRTWFTQNMLHGSFDAWPACALQRDRGPSPPKSGLRPGDPPPSSLVASSIQAPPVLQRTIPPLRSPAAASDTSTCSLPSTHRRRSARIPRTVWGLPDCLFIGLGTSPRRKIATRDDSEDGRSALLHFDCRRTQESAGH